MISAGGVVVARPDIHRGGGGASPTPALHAIEVAPISHRVAKTLLKREHYLHSLPGGTMLSFGVFLDRRMLGALTIGVGPKNVYQLIEGAQASEAATLTRLWLSDDLPSNSESRVIGVVLRALRKHTSLKFLVAYADPVQGHVGTVYQATGWIYTGESQPTPLIDIGDGVLRHGRSLAYSFGTHSIEYLRSKGVSAKLVAQTGKHRYVYLLDPSLVDRLTVPVLPFPKRGATDENC